MYIRAAWPPQEVYVARLTLSLAQGTTSAPQTIEYPFSPPEQRRGSAAEFAFETCRVRYGVADGVPDGAGSSGSSS